MMKDRRQERMVELATHLKVLRGELSQAERSVATLREARNAIFAELIREEYGIAVGDTVAWLGEVGGGPRRRMVTLRGMVLGIPLEGKLLVQRVNREGRPMEETLCLPAQVVALASRQTVPSA
jgi:hypothetical protein